MLHAVIDGWRELAKREARDTVKSCSALTIELIKCSCTVSEGVRVSAVLEGRTFSEDFATFFGGWRYSLRPNFVRHETLLCTLSLTMTYHRKSVSRQPGELLKFYEDTHLPIKAFRHFNSQCAFAWLKLSIQPYFWFGKGLTSQTGCQQSLLLSVCSQDINFQVQLV